MATGTSAADIHARTSFRNDPDVGRDSGRCWKIDNTVGPFQLFEAYSALSLRSQRFTRADGHAAISRIDWDSKRPVGQEYSWQL